jgi:hypothetical protein
MRRAPNWSTWAAKANVQLVGVPTVVAIPFIAAVDKTTPDQLRTVLDALEDGTLRFIKTARGATTELGEGEQLYTLSAVCDLQKTSLASHQPAARGRKRKTAASSSTSATSADGRARKRPRVQVDDEDRSEDGEEDGSVPE